MARFNVVDGALFVWTPKPGTVKDPGKQYPSLSGVVEVLGVRVRLTVWPRQKSKDGTREYWKVTGEYSQDEARRLVDVTPAAGQAEAEARERAEGSAPAPAEDPENIPF